MNQFKTVSSPQLASTPSETEISAKPQENNISIPKKTIPKTSQPSINRRNTPTVKPKINIEKSYYTPQAITYNFPLKSCGDKDPGGTNSWYPVYIRNTPENLDKVKTNYCRDAIVKYREKTGIKSIQVASFLNSTKAEEFANLMRNEIGSGEVGESSVYNFGNKSVKGSYKKYSSSQRLSPTLFIENYYINLSHGNYQTTWNQLSRNFKSKTRGYSEYVRWWNSVRKINIQQIRLIEENNNQALVYVDLTYVLNTGKYYNDPKNRISLIWDYQSNTWLFEQKF